MDKWNIWALLAGLGFSAVLFAWSSFNLYNLAAANLRLISSFGAMALIDGAMLQLLEILVYGGLSLGLYLAFRGFDTEIIERWRASNKD